MGKVSVIRHAQANYPLDELTSEGIEFAQNNRERFTGYSRTIASPLKRSQQTAGAFGYTDLTIDDRVREFEMDLQQETAELYVREVHIRFAKELYKYGAKLLDAIREYGVEEDCLIVSHNAVMSAAFYLLTGESQPFKNLEGFQVEVSSNDITNIVKIDVK